MSLAIDTLGGAVVSAREVVAEEWKRAFLGKGWTA
jgi:hypothetical protein